MESGQNGLTGIAVSMNESDTKLGRAYGDGRAPSFTMGVRVDMEPTWNEIKDAFREVLEEEMGVGKCRIASRWDGGKLVLQPFDSTQQCREVPTALFFKKITSVREKLRVLEQKINNHPSLSAEDKMEFQQLITRAYGSLTTFNFLFRDEDDKFVGSKSGE